MERLCPPSTWPSDLPEGRNRMRRLLQWIKSVLSMMKIGHKAAPSSDQGGFENSGGTGKQAADRPDIYPLW